MSSEKGTHLGGPAKLGDCPVLSGAVDAFIRANANFESSAAVTAAIDEMLALEDLQGVFEAPIRHKLLAMDAALCWALFLSSAPKHATSEGDPKLAKFSEKKALALIAAVYDVGMDSAVWEHFDADSEDEEDDDDEGETDEDDGPPSGSENVEASPKKKASSSRHK